MQTRIATNNGATPMTTRRRDTRTALDAYMEHHAAALALVARIHDALANHDDAPVEDPDTDINWGHVGDIAETRKALRELADRLFNEGEHAEIACLRCPATFATDAEYRHHAFSAH
jgi:hypothetical protein